MKKLFTFVFVIAILLLFGVCQAEEETVSVPKSQLTKDQLQKYDTQKVLESSGLSKFVGIGKEIGTAVNESLKAITVNVNEFANTKAGQVTVYLVAWQIAGRDIMRVTIGILFFFIVSAILCWSYWKTCITRKVLTKINADDSKEYSLVNDPSKMGDDDERGTLNGTRAVHALILIILIIICGIIMFG